MVRVVNFMCIHHIIIYMYNCCCSKRVPDLFLIPVEA